MKRHMVITPQSFLGALVVLCCFTFILRLTHFYPCNHKHSTTGEKHIPLEKKACEKVSLESTESGAGEQFPPLDCKAKARVKGMLLSQTPVAGWAPGIVFNLMALNCPNVNVNEL